MTPDEFIAKWRNVEATERSASQAHFIDLCSVLEVENPLDADRTGRDRYAFDKNVTKPGGSAGFADVWKRNCFAWEYKRDRKNLVVAYTQLKGYADALENPPLLIVSDMKEIRIHTNFTNTPSVTHTILLPDIMSVEKRRLLRWAFTEPERLRPTETHEKITAEAAAKFGEIAQKLRGQGYDPRRVAHFLNKIVFCLFVEDIDLLPDRVFADVLEESVKRPDEFVPMLGDLFKAMREDHGRFGHTAIPWFNGGLFDDDDVLPLKYLEICDLAEAVRKDWGYIDPSIFGTLFEKGLDPARRKEMAGLFDALGKQNGDRPHARLPGLDSPVSDKGVGIHYTDPATIMKLIEPVVLRPLRAEWEAVKATVREKRAAKEKAKSAAAKTKAENEARDAYLAFRDRLGKFRVLDPACGSGNFLYLALTRLKDFDLLVLDEAKALGLPPDDQRITPQAVLGIEINPYAAELARVTIWIGELQWQLRNSFGIKRRPILGQLKGIENRDALIGPDGKEAKWPKADAIVGNPPFLGGKRMKTALGAEYVENLFTLYRDRVPAEADLVCYWFRKAGDALAANGHKHFGLVATNSIRGGASRRVLQALRDKLSIYDAWDDEPWVIDGAAVRVSLVAFAPATDPAQHAAQPRLDGEAVEEIFADLTARRGATGADLTTAKRLTENRDVCFMGDTKGGAFDIPGDLARKWLLAPLNPNGRPNADVLKPWVNGMDVTRRSRDMWIIDFGWEMSEKEAALYELPFAWCFEHVKPERAKNNREHYRKFWWRHVEPRPGMLRALERKVRCVVTPTIAKHRMFAWLPSTVCPDHQLIVTTRDDDATFGILHSRLHELWALRMCSWLGVGNDPRYTPSTTFETFPFPERLTPNIPTADYTNDPRAKKIAAAAERLDELRNNWLNPPDLVKREPEVVPGYPDRILPVGAKAAAELKKRTLTNLYNARPTWLADAHRALDEAVAAAYGWPADLSDDEILKRLLELNLARAAAQG